MKVDWDAIQKRLTQKDAGGRYIMAVTGGETDDELREIAARMASVCPTNPAATGCPFKMLSGLSPVSRHRTLELMTRASLMEMFELEQACRNKVFEYGFNIACPPSPENSARPET